MVQYTIQPGDTLVGIASRFGVTAEAILAANPGLFPYSFLAGRVILIRVAVYPEVPAYPTYPYPYAYPVPFPFFFPFRRFPERREFPRRGPGFPGGMREFPGGMRGRR